MGASKGLTTGLGELLSDIQEPLTKANKDPKEAQSTEELMRSIKEANMRLSEVE